MINIDMSDDNLKYLMSVMDKEMSKLTEHQKNLCLRYCQSAVRYWPIEHCIGRFMSNFNSRYEKSARPFCTACVNYYWIM